MKLYQAGIKSYQLDLGIECSAFSDPGLERTSQGIKHDHNEPRTRVRTPLTRPLLLRILSSDSHSSSYQNTVIQAAFILAFAGFLRVEEFTYRDTDREMGPAFSKWFLTKSCVRLSRRKGHLYLNIPASKTDPFQEGIMLTIAASNDNGCPVRAMTQFLAMDTHRPPNAPLICVGMKNQYPFSREYVVCILQKRAIRAGLLQGS